MEKKIGIVIDNLYAGSGIGRHVWNRKYVHIHNLVT